MINLVQVPYDLNSGNEIVAATLQTKKMSQMHPGIGPHSCWAGVGYILTQNPVMQIQTGFSQMKNDLEYSPYKNDWVKYHGELSGLNHAIEAIMNSGHAVKHVFPIVGVYVEMSPCPRCKPALQNLLPDGTTVMFSFNYETEKSAWLQAASDLCNG